MAVIRPRSVGCDVGTAPVRGVLRLALLAVAFPAVVSPSGPALAQEGPPSAEPKKQAVSFRDPERAYQAVQKGAWTFQVEKPLMESSPGVAEKAIARLERNLDEAFQRLPEPCHERLKRLPVYLMAGPGAPGGGKNNGLEYFSREAPRFHKHLDPHWSSCIVVYCAKNYTDISDLWALKAVVHELAHAHHREQWPEKQPDILAAWQHAKAGGLYLDVTDENGKTIPRAYALANQLEYFAELSTMYFARCNYPPTDREALRQYDPAGFAMIEKIWGVAVDR